MESERRRFLKQSGFAIAVATVAGPPLLFFPAEAKAKEIPLKVLAGNEQKTLEAAADILLPGSAQAGVAYYIDEQLARDPSDSLLIARYFQVTPPYADFYRASVRALNAYALAAHDKEFPLLEKSIQEQLVGNLFPEQPKGWQGPPAPLVYLCIRNDAVDVMYGTMDGFERLGISYMAHIEPPAKW